MKPKFDLTKPYKTTSAVAMQGTMEENRISGVASVTGSINGNNVLFYPGAHQSALAEFRKRGFVSESHNWDSAVAMPTMIEEDGVNLNVEAEFHTTPDAQILRTKCAERLAKGLFVGFSTGILAGPGNWCYFEDGQTCWDHAKGYGVDMSLMDPSIKDAEDFFAVFKVEDLVEWSIVPFPAVRTAGASAVSSFNPLAGLTFEQELEQALDTVGQLITRAEEIHAMRAEQGRTLSSQRIDSIKELEAKFAALSAAISDATRPSVTDEMDARLREARLRSLELFTV